VVVVLKYPMTRFGSFRLGGARPQTQVMVDFIDRQPDEYGVEPICTDLPIAPSTCTMRRKACQAVSPATPPASGMMKRSVWNFSGSSTTIGSPRRAAAKNRNGEALGTVGRRRTRRLAVMVWARIGRRMGTGCFYGWKWSFLIHRDCLNKTKKAHKNHGLFAGWRPGLEWWAMLGSNQRPLPCEGVFPVDFCTSKYSPI